MFLSSELEEFLELCTRVMVFRNGTSTTQFEPPYDGHAILNAMFGRRADADLVATEHSSEHEAAQQQGPAFAARYAGGRPVARPVVPARLDGQSLRPETAVFALHAPDIAPGQVIPSRFAEDQRRSPHLIWSGAPDGTRSFALAITDPDLPEEFNFPRAFAQWLVHDIPAAVHELTEGASGTALMPSGAIELNSDFVTFRIPGFGRGYGGPWPSDRPHRYVFTVYALKTERLAIDPDANLIAFAAAVMPAVIASASFTAVYGPARKPLPAPAAAKNGHAMTGGRDEQVRH